MAQKTKIEDTKDCNRVNDENMHKNHEVSQLNQKYAVNSECQNEYEKLLEYVPSLFKLFIIANFF